ncbi:PH domain-containing protein [Alkalicoccobacillus gibsonii]|uniref:PH domain-containing protein n=1 Tax=Alkalicoccobacillus gibsonii TaxID=79881 RepID=UPI0019340601|nr:PH domain-containing protein [Alkalicoccobacillus gibsonii]MBM0064257.1 PH domain-containing protein [Alkalicoccobacillus gibsonii]
MTTFKEQVAPLGKTYLLVYSTHLKTLQSLLESDESILTIGAQSIHGNRIFAVTENRLIVVKSKEHQTFKRDQIQNIRVKPKMLNHEVSFNYNEEKYHFLPEEGTKLFSPLTDSKVHK